MNDDAKKKKSKQCNSSVVVDVHFPVFLNALQYCE